MRVVMLLLALASMAQERSSAVRDEFRKVTGFVDGREGYVADHVYPLCAGGLDVLSNLQWQDKVSAKAKDIDERALCTHIRAFRSKWSIK